MQNYICPSQILMMKKSYSRIWTIQTYGQKYGIWTSIKKFKHMRLGAKTPLQQYTMKSGVERVSLEQVTSEKDLGVTVDNKLLFREHISKKSAIANRNLGIIFKSFTYLDKEMHLCLFKSLVRPHVEYATTVWYPMY